MSALHDVDPQDRPSMAEVADDATDVTSPGGAAPERAGGEAALGPSLDDMKWLLAQRGEAGHCHEVPGIWDWDNGDRAGKPCETCARYVRITEAVAAFEARILAAVDAVLAPAAGPDAAVTP